MACGFLFASFSGLFSYTAVRFARHLLFDLAGSMMRRARGIFSVLGPHMDLDMYLIESILSVVTAVEYAAYATATAETAEREQ